MQPFFYTKETAWILALKKRTPQAPNVAVCNQSFQFDIKCFLDCATNCETCDNKECLTCEINYFLYEGDCLNSCPTKTYVQEISCIGNMLNEERDP